MVIWSNSNPTLINNTIANNYTGGISIEEDCNPDFINNIIWGNTITSGNNVRITDTGSCPDFYYCDIEGGLEGFVGNGAGNNFCGFYENCKNEDPLFVDPEIGDFHLIVDSPCIDAGDPSYPNDPDGTICDMGALYYDQLISIDNYIEQPGIMVNCYPNPMNTKTTIEFSILEEGFVLIFIIDITGKQVNLYVSENLPAGKHEYKWNAEGLPAGIYFLRLETNGISETRKIQLIK